MNEIYGNAGTILHVDLSTKEVKKEPVTEEMVREYIGGQGFSWAKRTCKAGS